MSHHIGIGCHQLFALLLLLLLLRLLVLSFLSQPLENGGYASACTELDKPLHFSYATCGVCRTVIL